MNNHNSKRPIDVTNDALMVQEGLRVPLVETITRENKKKNRLTSAQLENLKKLLPGVNFTLKHTEADALRMLR